MLMIKLVAIDTKSFLRKAVPDLNQKSYLLLLECTIHCNYFLNVSVFDICELCQA